MSFSATKYQKVKYGQERGVINHKDYFNNSYDLIKIKKRKNKITSAYLKKDIEIYINDFKFNLRSNQIITFHPNNMLKNFYAENLNIHSLVFKKAKIYIGSNGKIQVIVSKNTKIKFFKSNKKEYMLVEQSNCNIPELKRNLLIV